MPVDPGERTLRPKGACQDASSSADGSNHSAFEADLRLSVDFLLLTELTLGVMAFPDYPLETSV